MTRASFCMPLLLLALFPALFGCQERTLTPAEIQDQHRFMTGCQPADAARDYTEFLVYCDRF
jgi:hypothetical protein